jgi:hypothetical protein
LNGAKAQKGELEDCWEYNGDNDDAPERKQRTEIRWTLNEADYLRFTKATNSTNTLKV